MKRITSLVLVLALGLTSEVANADFTFGTPTNLGPTVNSPYSDCVPSISADGVTLYFSDWPAPRPGGVGSFDIWVTTRDTIDDEWGTPLNLGATVNSSSGDGDPHISADGLTLYFSDFGDPRPGGVGEVDIWVTTRATKDNEWGSPVNLGATVNTVARDAGPSISADGLALFLYSNRPGGVGGVDIWVATRPTKDDDWGTPVWLGPTVNSSAHDCCPSISADGRTIFFGSNRPGGYGSWDLWLTTRATTDDPWGEPVNLGPTVNSSAMDDGASISADGSTLFFTSNRPGGVGNYDLWQAPIEPVVDFNGDGIIDSADMCIIVEHWHTDEPLCDIGPMPWGDGIVDVQDLIVLAEHLFEDVNDSTLVAHWALDEAEGILAHDSAGENDAYFIGDPIWQPAGGMVDGALQLDGVDDCAITGSIPNPTEGPFSVFAWVKGGAPGQVILSQEGGVNWLMADAVDGALKTDLKEPGTPGRTPIPPGPPLISSTIITDGEWHRVGFVWDGSQRMLYVDDVEVATDVQGSLEGSVGALYIGAGNALEPGSFFSGLIDDVRIYNRAVTP